MTFPYNGVLSKSKRFWNLDYRNNKKIHELEKNVKNRLSNGNITNKKYSEMINWIEDYKNLFLDQVTADQTTNRPITSIEAQDYIYEAWIFFELLDFIESKKGYRCYLKFQKRESPEQELDRYFYFYINNTKITIYYEKVYQKWADYKQKPDFTVEIDNDVTLVMDAKNYTGGESRAGVNSIIVGYIGYFNAEEGMLFFPDYPSNEFIKHFPNNDGNNRGYTRLRFSPSSKPELIEMRDKTLGYIFQQINKSEKIKLSI